MLTIICGENSVESRNHFANLQTEYKQKEFFVYIIAANQIQEIAKNFSDELLLFNEKKVFFTSALTTFVSKKKDKEFLSMLQTLISNKNIEIFDWEDKSARDIKIKDSELKEFKPSQTIFQLLDSCYPHNLKIFINNLNKVAETQQESFIYTMLCRHIRTLVLARTNQLPSSVPFWMKKKQQDQAEKWQLESLIGFYDGLTRVDLTLKTTQNIYGLKKTVELLSCYFLK